MSPNVSDRRHPIAGYDLNPRLTMKTQIEI